MAESPDMSIISSDLQDIHSPMREEDDDVDNLTKNVVASREAIRQRLASSGHNLDDLESKNLLVCFLNEEASEDEDDDDVLNGDVEADEFGVVNGGWSSNAEKHLMCMEKLSSKTLAKNNISKRKGQIIIPLRCAVQLSESSSEEDANEEENEDANEVIEDEKEANLKNDKNEISKEKRFLDKLSSIQVDARRRLREAKSIAVRTVESERKSQQMNSEIHKMLGLRPGSKLSRSVLTSMTVGQLEFILNSLLSQIEILNEDLVQYLINRDELAIEQDSLLTDIEDITKCIGGVRQSLETSMI